MPAGIFEKYPNMRPQAVCATNLWISIFSISLCEWGTNRDICY